MNIWQTSITYIYGAVKKTKLFSFKRKTLQVGIPVVHYKTKDTSSHLNKKPVLGIIIIIIIIVIALQLAAEGLLQGVTA